MFHRIDEYHSIAYLSEELSPDSAFWEDKIIVHNEGEILMVKHESFPHWQDGITTLVYVDDKYTYIANYVICYDGHVAPPHLGSVLRLDKEVKEEE